jgi:hypothetical protein
MVQQEDELDKKFAIAPRYNYLKNIISWMICKYVDLKAF